MISIITSTYRPKYLTQLEYNIAQTIGDIPYELISVNNPNVMGVCAAYNIGASRAKYELLCFVHEDVCFVNQNWGQRIVDHFEEHIVGAIGIAGTAYKSKIPSSWSVYKPLVAYNLIQYNEEGESKRQTYGNGNNLKRKQVVSLDGVLLVTRAKVWKMYSFDYKTFTGYHGYDMDFSMQVNQHYKLYVVFDILLEHYSPGNPDASWLDAAIKFSNKWSNLLPVTCFENLPKTTLEMMELNARKSFIKRSKNLGYSKFRIMKLIFRHVGFRYCIDLWK